MAMVSATSAIDGAGALSAAWRSLSDYFLPEGMSDERGLANPARMFLISHLLGPLLGNTVPLALYAVDPTPGWDILLLAGSICLFWAFPFALRHGIRYERLVLLSVLNLNFCILWSCYHNGGVTSPTLTWVLIIPILSLFYIGGERGLQPMLLGASALAFAAFVGAYQVFAPPTNDLPDGAMLGLGAVSTIATLAYVATMAIYYARIFDAGRDLEVEVLRRRQMAEELRQAIVKTHRVSAAKAEFLARMSHEIRTPLNAIIGYGQILREDAQASEDRMTLEDTDRILVAARYLVRLINMILDLAKLEAGRMNFDLRPHSLAELLGEAAEARQECIAAGDNTLAMQVEPGLDGAVVDRQRLLQIFDAVLENAARHTRGGRIAVVARCIPAGSGEGIAISVTDTGSGMSPEAMLTLFETFQTARTAADGRYGGTGLNMAVCSQLCRAMGGSISVSSCIGEGSTFTIRLPFGRAEGLVPADRRNLAALGTRVAAA